MSGELVTVAREISSLNANLIRTRLEADGIRCFMMGEAAASVIGSPSYVGAYIDVQVQPHDAERAKQILREIRDASKTDGDNTVRLKPSFELQLLRGTLIGGVIWFVAMSVLGITSNATLATIAGAIALVAGIVLLVKATRK